ncbi:hypothetical protein HDV03_001849 [Kappamyces sp. JEL0829]|nr:hypothetical protein HDV03_001849 [Kappamyces sp. JEL0829]
MESIKQSTLSTMVLERTSSTQCLLELSTFQAGPALEDAINSTTLQYSSLYSSRLEQLAPRVKMAAQATWTADQALECSRVASIPQTGMMAPEGRLWVLGTLYCDMPLKECVLDEIGRQNWVEAPPPREKYTSDQDKVILEDESGRVVLSGPRLKEYLLTTGMIVGVMGKQEADGSSLVVEEIVFPLLEPQPSLPLESDSETWIAIVSGLDIGATDPSAQTGDFLVQLFADWISGELGSKETRALTSKISRLYIAGNSLAQPSAEDEARRTVKNKFGRGVVEFDPHPLESLDEFFSSLLPSLHVGVISGQTDPTTHLLPQKPIHPSLLHESNHYSSLSTLSNPVFFKENETLCIGTGGQIIDDIFKYVDTSSRLDIATTVMASGIVAPTCPDTLWTRPFIKDPFCMTTPPHLFFVGNQPEFATRLITGPRGVLSKSARSAQDEAMDQGLPAEESCRVVLVPKFRDSGIVVLVRLETLECKTVCFKNGLAL